MSEHVFAATEKVPRQDEDDLNTLIGLLKEEILINAKYTFIYKIMKECLDEHIIKEPLAKKVRNIILAHETSQCLKINSNGKTCQLFGLDETTEAPLTYEEKRVIKQCFLDKLETYNDFEKRLQDIIGNHKYSSYITVPEISSQDKVMMDMRESLKAGIESYVKNISEMTELLEDMRKLRLETLPRLCEDKYHETKLRNSMADCKANYLSQRVKMNILTETSVTLEAYKKISEDISSQQDDCRREIKELQELKEKYKTVACKEYDEILKSYLRYLSSIDLYKKINQKL